MHQQLSMQSMLASAEWERRSDHLLMVIRDDKEISNHAKMVMKHDIHIKLKSYKLVHLGELVV